RSGGAPVRSQSRGRAEIRQAGGTREAIAGRDRESRPATGTIAPDQGGGERRGHRLGGESLDWHTGDQTARGRDAEAPAPRGGTAPAGNRPGRSGDGGRRSRDPRPQRSQGPEPPDRQLYFSGPHGSGKDGAGESARRVPLR